MAENPYAKFRNDPLPGMTATKPEPPPADEYAGTGAEPARGSTITKQDVVDWLKPDPNMVYGSPPREEDASVVETGGRVGQAAASQLSPFARDPKTGLTHLTLPPIVRNILLGLVEGPGGDAVTINPMTNTLGVTPEAAAAGSLGAPPLRIGPMGRVPPGLAAREAPLSPEFRGAPMAAPAEAKVAAAPPDAPITVPDPVTPTPFKPAASQEVPPTSPTGEPVTPPARPAESAPPTAPVAPGAPKTLAEAREAAGRMVAETKASAGQLYDLAAQSGGTLTPQFVDKFITEAQKIAPQTEAGLTVAGETPITSLVARVKELAKKPISLAGAQEIDEALGNMIDKEWKDGRISKDGNALHDLQTQFRDMIGNAQPGDISGGAQGFEALKKGRGVWAQAMKMRDIERLMMRAEGQAQPSTGIITGVRQLLANPTRRRGWSAEEIAALERARDRGALGELTYQLGSRLVPLAAGGVGSFGGPIGAGLAYGVTHFGSNYSRGIAERMQTRRLQGVMDVLRQRVPSITPNDLGPP